MEHREYKKLCSTTLGLHITQSESTKLTFQGGQLCISLQLRLFGIILV